MNTALKSATLSGRYEFKDWIELAPQQFEARKVRATPDHIPALISTAYSNPDGTRTVYGIVFDLDVYDPTTPSKVCADRKWEDSLGRLDWTKMEKALRAVCPELAASITHVVRSGGGKGLAVLIGITPLPIRDSTIKNQAAARSLQGRVAALFSRLGFGPDPSARGLERDFPNWRDPSRVVLYRRDLQRRVEESREPVVTMLHRVLNKVDKANEPYRLYRDTRAEAGLAKLALWLLGELVPRAPQSFLARPDGGRDDSLPALQQFIGFLAESQPYVSVRDLVALTGLGEAFLRRLLKEPPAWLRAEHVSREEGWRIWVPLDASLGDLLSRSRDLVASGKQSTVGSSWSPEAFPRPEAVEDGERNAWIVKLALTYKWSGYSLDAALRKIQMRVLLIPGNERSKNCREVKRIVRNIYKRMPELEGRNPHQKLPKWVSDDAGFNLEQGRTKCDINKHSNPGRGIAPSLFSASLDLASPRMAQPQTLLESPRELVTSAAKRERVWMIRWKQRIGIVHENEIVVVLTRSHFRAALVEEWIASLPRFVGTEPYLRAPRKGQFSHLHADLEAAPVRPSWHVCGRRERLSDALLRWQDQSSNRNPALAHELTVPRAPARPGEAEAPS